MISAHLSRRVGQVLCVAILILYAGGCTNQPTAPTMPDAANLEATITAAVAATVEVAVAATIESQTGDSMAGSGSTPATDEANPSIKGSTLPEPDITPDPTVIALAEMSAYVAANTRHYIGDPNAPVVFIEYSDFL